MIWKVHAFFAGATARRFTLSLCARAVSHGNELV